MQGDKIRRLRALRAQYTRNHPRKPAIGRSPQAELLEARWLGCILFSPPRLIEAKLPPQAFRLPHHRDIYTAMLSVHLEGGDARDLPQLYARLETYGYGKLTSSHMLQAILNSTGDTKYFADYTAELRKRFEATDAPQAVAPFTSLTTAELMGQETPRQWLVANLLTRGEAGVIVGPSKCLKTSLAVDLCAALASGRKFLGRFAVAKPVRVGFVSGSGQQQALLDLSRRWHAARQATQDDLTNLMWSLSVEDPTDPARLAQLRDWIEQYELEVVVIDPLRLSSTGKRKQAEAIGALTQCCLQAGATPILCVQTRKEMKPGKLDVAILAGSLDFARQWLLVNRRQAYSPGSGEHRLWLSAGGYAGQGGEWGVDIEEGKSTDAGGRRWEVDVQEAEALKEEAAQLAEAAHHRRLETKIRAAIEERGEEGARKGDVRENCGMNGGRFSTTWNRMMTAGKIVEMPKEPYSTRKRYTLPPSDEKNENERSSPPPTLTRGASRGNAV